MWGLGKSLVNVFVLAKHESPCMNGVSVKASLIISKCKSLHSILYIISDTISDGDGSKPWYLVNPKIAGKWMFIPLEMVLIGIDPYPDTLQSFSGGFGKCQDDWNETPDLPIGAGRSTRKSFAAEVQSDPWKPRGKSQDALLSGRFATRVSFRAESDG